MIECGSAPLMRCVTDDRLRIVDVSGALAEVLHRPEQALLGMDVIALTHPDDRAGNLDRLADLQRFGHPFAITKRYLRADATSVWVRNHISRGLTADGAETRVATVEVLPGDPASARGCDLATAEQVIRLRRLRATRFADAFATEPALDMMLALFTREERGLKSTVGTLCQSTDAPYATAHRRFIALADAGMVTTAVDAEDRRLVVVRLTRSGREHVEAFLGAARRLV